QCWRRIARAVEAHGERESTTFESSMIILMNELFLELLRMFENQPITLDRRLSSSSRTVEMFLADMAKHDDKLAHPWQVDEMAQACGLGHARFTALCRQLTNVTPMQYLTQCRIK